MLPANAWGGGESIIAIYIFGWESALNEQEQAFRNCEVKPSTSLSMPVYVTAPPPF